MIIHNLSVQIGQQSILSSITAQVAENTVVAIVGPSGSGKSTLLRCMNLLTTPTTGQIIIDGQDITKPGYDIKTMRRYTGMVFQHFHLFPHMTVLKNIAYAPCNVLKIKSQEANDQAYDLLARVGLSDKAMAYPGQLSGGQKQRVAIARALAMQPKIMLFDEPTSALDPEMVKEVLDVIKNLVHTSMTIMLVTHEMSFAREIADEIWFMDQGKILEQTAPEVFFKNPQTERARKFLNTIL